MPSYTIFVSELAKWFVKIPLEHLFTLVKEIPRGLFVIFKYSLAFRLKVTDLFTAPDNNEEINELGPRF